MTINREYGHGGNIHVAADAGSIEIDTILDFSANINPLGAPGLAAILYQQ